MSILERETKMAMSAEQKAAEESRARQQHQQRTERAAKTAEQGRQETRRVSLMPIVNGRVAGIDIGSRTHWVCVAVTSDPDDRQAVREFPAYTVGLREIVAWLREHGVTTVAMESTGIYWIPLFELLESEGFEVFLVDPSYTKQVRGRPKTDRRDAQWIYRLHSVGMLTAAYRPDGKTCALRSYLRQRQTLIRYSSRHILHMQKALEQMNVKLTEVLSDIMGVTGHKIIKAILHGERDPRRLAQLRHGCCKKDEEELARALDGTWREEHLFALEQAHQLWQTYQERLEEVDARLAKQLGRMELQSPLPELPEANKQPTGHRNEPRFDVRAALYKVAGMDLTAIEGISGTTALVLIAEVGVDLSKFPTADHFCSWLGLCPCLKKTGGKIKSSRTRSGVNRVAEALRLAANTLWHSRSAMGAYYRRMKARLGAPKAITAAAHKLARRVYFALKYGLPYVMKTQEEYEEQIKQRQLQSLQRRARQMGFQLLAAGEMPNETVPASA
jgi:transposase